MVKYRKPRAHIGTNDPEQIKQWSNKFAGCNWATEIDRACITVLDLDHHRRTPSIRESAPIVVTATSGGTHHFCLDPDRDPITGEPEIMSARLGPASADGDADAGWFWVNKDKSLRVRPATQNERNIEKGITVTIVRALGTGIRVREFGMIPEDLIEFVLKHGEKCLVNNRSGVLIPGSRVDGHTLE